MQEPLLVKLSTTYRCSAKPQCVIRTQRLDSRDVRSDVPEFELDQLDADKCVFLSKENERDELRLVAAPGWSLCTLSILSTCRLMEVSSPLQYLCSLEGELLDVMEETAVFLATINLAGLNSGGGEDSILILRPPASIASLWLYGITVAVTETKKSSRAGHFDLNKVNSLLADQPLSSKAERFKLLFDSFQNKSSLDGALPPLGPPFGWPLPANLGPSGPPSFAALLSNPQLLTSFQQPTAGNPQLPVSLQQPPAAILQQIQSCQQPASHEQCEEISDTQQQLSLASESKLKSGGDAGSLGDVAGTGDQLCRSGHNLESTASGGSGGVGVIDPATRAYIDNRLAEMETRLLDRMEAMEQKINRQLELLLSRLSQQLPT